MSPMLSLFPRFLYLEEGWTAGDCLYFAVVIATTVGYGDVLPTTPASKVGAREGAERQSP